MDQVPKIIEALKEKARKILAPILGTKELVAFDIGGLGMFPYVWRDPTSSKFNAKTYAWISAALKADTIPSTQDGVFTNRYIEVLSKVSYGYSAADKAALARAHEETIKQQAALLAGWKRADFPMPPGPQPINGVLTEIQTQWAEPPTTLQEIKKSPDLKHLLNKTPPAGLPVLPLLARYLNAFGSSVSLLNQTTMNTGYLATALRAVQFPDASNGGLYLNTRTPLVPRYLISPPPPDILKELRGRGQDLTLRMTSPANSRKFWLIDPDSRDRVQASLLPSFRINVGGDASYFSKHLVSSSSAVTVTAKFTGVTQVSYGPANFRLSTGKYWFWMNPIRGAIANTGPEIQTGFRFAPNPNIDFGVTGPFAFTTNAAIANWPEFKIEYTASDYKKIEEKFRRHPRSRLRFLGIRLASASESAYANRVSVDSSSETVTVTLSPPHSLKASSSPDATAWVLGVVTDYPAA